MSHLVISDLHAGIPGQEILDGISLTVNGGEVHAVMGRNGSGKSTLSHVVMGKPGYAVTSGSVTLDGVSLLELPTWQRARAGLFLAMQYPIEVPGVSLIDALSAARSEAVPQSTLIAEALRIGFDARFLERPLNVDLSGGERKRNETLQLAVLTPKIAILDELDSGLDVDALRDVSRRVAQMVAETGLGVLAITHYSRMLRELRPDVVHILSKGRLVATEGPELVDELERDGYARFEDESELEMPADPFADPFA
ncbi:MAG: Fe-S cluster assembly ATPase SufC [Acidimicrobiales bacterium]